MRQCPDRYAFRAGRNLPDKEFRYLRTVIVTAAVHRGFNSRREPLIFVALDDVFIEGLIHVSDLGRDYFHFDEAAHAMVGERTGVRYRLSDRVRVKLVRVDMEQNKIDFRLVDQPSQKIAGGGAGGAGAGYMPPGKSAKSAKRR